jgi:hypothetical protein
VDRHGVGPDRAGEPRDRPGRRDALPGRAATAGRLLQIDLGRVHPVGMVAWPPGAYQEVPVGFRLDTSVDGTAWTVAREVPTYYGPLYWAAGHPMGRVSWGRVEARFPPRPARHVRLTHVGRDERYPWTVREIFLYEAGDPGSASAVDAGRRHLSLDAGARAQSRPDRPGRVPSLVGRGAASARAARALTTWQNDARGLRPRRRESSIRRARRHTHPPGGGSS